MSEKERIQDVSTLKDAQDVHYVNMPNKVLKDGTTRQDIAHPITEPCRRYLENKVLDAYEERLNENN